MINEANDHPRYAVDVQRIQSKPGHPHATVVDYNYTPSAEKSKLPGPKNEKEAAPYAPRSVRLCSDTKRLSLAFSRSRTLLLHRLAVCPSYAGYKDCRRASFVLRAP